MSYNKEPVKIQLYLGTETKSRLIPDFRAQYENPGATPCSTGTTPAMVTNLPHKEIQLTPSSHPLSGALGATL